MSSSASSIRSARVRKLASCASGLGGETGHWPAGRAGKAPHGFVRPLRSLEQAKTLSAPGHRPQPPWARPVKSRQKAAVDQLRHHGRGLGKIRLRDHTEHLPEEPLLLFRVGRQEPDGFQRLSGQAGYTVE